MLAIIIWLFFLGKTYSTDDIIDAHFWIVGNPRECFSMFVHRNIKWIPDLLGFYLKMEYISSKRENRTLETTYFVRKRDTICYKDLKVPFRDIRATDTIKLEMNVYWNKKTIIDKALWTLNIRDKKDNLDNYWIFGERNIILFGVQFSIYYDDFPRHRNGDFLWSNVIEGISIDKPICLRVWNRPDIYRLFPNVKHQNLPQLYEYSYMNISAYIDNNMWQIVHQETHLVNIYQCENEVNQQLQIVVFDSVVAVSVIFWESMWFISQRINLIKENGLFSTRYNLIAVSSMIDIVVTTKDFKTAWEDRRNKFFLHAQSPIIKRCADSSGQNKRVVEIETFKNEKVRYILNSRAQTIGPRYKITYWRTATQAEEEWCTKFKYTRSMNA